MEYNLLYFNLRLIENLNRNPNKSYLEVLKSASLMFRERIKKGFLEEQIKTQLNNLEETA